MGEVLRYGATIQLVPLLSQPADCRAGCETRELVRVQMTPYPFLSSPKPASTAVAKRLT